jgi:hypothetical protein
MTWNNFIHDGLFGFLGFHSGQREHAWELVLTLSVPQKRMAGRHSSSPQIVDLEEHQEKLDSGLLNAKKPHKRKGITKRPPFCIPPENMLSPILHGELRVNYIYKYMGTNVDYRLEGVPMEVADAHGDVFEATLTMEQTELSVVEWERVLAVEHAKLSAVSSASSIRKK